MKNKIIIKSAIYIPISAMVIAISLIGYPCTAILLAFAAIESFLLWE